MKIKNGFTLIELLAVIVILAIIALIAVPIVLGIIDNTRKSANKISIDSYGKAVENTVMVAQMKGEVLPDGIYTLKNDKICNSDVTPKCITVEVNGKTPIYYTMTIAQGKIIEQIIKLVENSSPYIKVENESFVEAEEIYMNSLDQLGYVGKPLNPWCIEAAGQNSCQTNIYSLYGGFNTQEECEAVIQSYSQSTDSTYQQIAAVATCVQRETKYETDKSKVGERYIKALKVNDMIKTAYACFVRTKNGKQVEYCLKGNDKLAYTTNRTLIVDAYSEQSEHDVCRTAGDEYYCGVDNSAAKVNTNGSVFVYYDTECFVVGDRFGCKMSS